MKKSEERLIKEQAIDQDASTIGRGTSNGSNNKRLDGGWSCGQQYRVFAVFRSGERVFYWAVFNQKKQKSYPTKEIHNKYKEKLVNSLVFNRRFFNICFRNSQGCHKRKFEESNKSFLGGKIENFRERGIGRSPFPVSRNFEILRKTHAKNTGLYFDLTYNYIELKSNAV